MRFSIRVGTHNRFLTYVRDDHDRPGRNVPLGRRCRAPSLDDPPLFGIIFDRHFTTIYGYLARRIGEVIADGLGVADIRSRFRTKTILATS
jgi:hypothetical protein